MVKDSELSTMLEKTQAFCTERDWDQFHDAKELAICLVTEASELLECFRFQSREESEVLMKDPAKREHIEDEIADSLFFILRYANLYQVDLPMVLERKMKQNAAKYPVEKARGSRKKYTEL